MQKFSHVIRDAEGLHARPAGMLVKCAQGCGSQVTMTTSDGTSADAKRLFAVMKLGVRQNDSVTITVAGPDEDSDSEKLKAFCEANL